MNSVPFFVLFLCLFSFLSILDIFDPVLCLSRSFQIRFVYRDSDVYRTFFYCYPDVFRLSQSFIMFQICFLYRDLLSRSRYVSPIAIFFRDPVMILLLRYSFAVQLCFVNRDLLSRSRYVLSVAFDLVSRSSYVSSITIFFIDLDMFCLLRSIFFRNSLQ